MHIVIGDLNKALNGIPRIGGRIGCRPVLLLFWRSIKVFDFHNPWILALLTLICILLSTDINYRYENESIFWINTILVYALLMIVMLFTISSTEEMTCLSSSAYAPSGRVLPSSM